MKVWKWIVGVAVGLVTTYLFLKGYGGYIREAMKRAEVERDPRETPQEVAERYERKVQEIAKEIAGKDAERIVEAWESRFGKG